MGGYSITEQLIYVHFISTISAVITEIVLYDCPAMRTSPKDKANNKRQDYRYNNKYEEDILFQKIEKKERS